ncbi:MAG: hypothetical protein IT185_10430 [Acidobacteria bacterium]|nr:hypothetical protein [Acidobacteriota bacterium]
MLRWKTVWRGLLLLLAVQVLVTQAVTVAAPAASASSRSDRAAVVPQQGDAPTPAPEAPAIPAPSIVPATIEFEPDAPDARRQGDSIAVLIELPDDTDLDNINVSTVSGLVAGQPFAGSAVLSWPAESEPTATSEPAADVSPTGTPTEAPTPEATSSATRVPEPIQEVTATVTATPTDTSAPPIAPADTETPVLTSTPTATATDSPTPGETPSPAPTATPLPISTPSATPGPASLWLPMVVAGHTPTPAPVVPQAGTVRTYLSPAVSSVTVGQEFNVNLVVAAGSQPVAAVDAFLDFAPAYVQVVSITPDTGALATVLLNSFDNSLGRITYAAGKALGGADATGTFRIAAVRLRAMAGTTGTNLAFAFEPPLRNTDAFHEGLSVLGTATGASVVIAGPTATGTPTPTRTPTQTPASATATPTRTPTRTPAPTQAATGTDFYLSLANNGSYTVGSVTGVGDEDILRFAGGVFTMVFDGSDVGLGAADVDAFAVVGTSTLLLSFDATTTVPGLGSVADADIVQFNATSLGANTTGAFVWYFDGSDVGLTEAGEDIAALERLPDGRLLISPLTSALVPGFSIRWQGEDVLAFTPTGLGSNTGGTWAIYFDGSDVGLGADTEDVDGVAVAANGDLYLTTPDNFNVPGLVGADEDVFACRPGSLGSATACTYPTPLYFDGSAFGLAGNDVDGIDFP